MQSLTLFFLFSLFFGKSLSKNTNHSSQDILQSNGPSASDPKRSSQERCSSDPEDSVDKQFRDYVENFSNSESGRFLKDLVTKSETVSKLSNPIKTLLRKVDKVDVNELKSVSKEPFNKTWLFVSLFLSSVYAVVLGYLTIICPLSSYTVLTISSYVLCSVVMGLTHDVLPLWLVASVGIVGDAVVWVALSFLDGVKRRQVCVLSICMVFSKVVYDLHAVIPYEYISPNFCGFAGFLVNYVFRANNFMLVRIVYLVMLILFTGCSFIQLPSFVAGEPMELQEIDVGGTIMKRLICFVSALPAAGLCTQVYSALRKQANPLGPMTFFTVPTKLRINELGTYLAVVLWATIAMVYYEMIKHYPENRLLTPSKKRRSWRAYTRTISRL